MSNNNSDLENVKDKNLQRSNMEESQESTLNATIESTDQNSKNNSEIMGKNSEKNMGTPIKNTQNDDPNDKKIDNKELESKEFVNEAVDNKEIDNKEENSEDFDMPDIPEVDPATGEILNAENTKNTGETGDQNLEDEEETEVEKTEKELKKEKKQAAALARKEKIKSIFHKICKHFARLKQKKYWIPLVVGHLIMFSCMGYYAYKEIQYAKSTDFVIDSIEEALEQNDLSQFLSLFNFSIAKDRLKKSIKKALENNPDFAKYIGELADDASIDAAFEKSLVNIVTGIDENPHYNQVFHLFPVNLTSQIRKQPFIFNEHLSKPQNSIYIFEVILETVRFGKYPLQIKARYFKDKWSIVEISNIASIVAQFDKEIQRIRLKQDTFKAEEQAVANALILQYLPNLQCSANLTKQAGQDVLILHVTTDEYAMKDNLVAWAVETKVFVDDALVHEEYIKANGIYQGGTDFSHTSNIRLSEAQSESLIGHTLRCEAIPELINLPEGVFYTYED